ncbi:MAG: glycosyltransferase family 1 protein [bacterium]|nr:glycosyltransferase family 1 protein [bacterium]
MKIGINATYAASDHPTGIGNYTINLIRHLARVDKKNEYILYYRYRTDEKKFLQAGFPSRRFEPGLGFLMPDRLDLFHDPAFKYIRIGKSRSIVTVHDMVVALPEDYTSEKFKKTQTPKLMKALRRSDALITVSRFTRDELVRKLGVPEKKISVVHHGIDTLLFRTDKKPAGPPALYKLPKEYILFVGNIEKRKNLIGLVTVFERVNKVHPGLHLLLIGRNGYGHETIRDRIRSSPRKDRIRMIDYVQSQDLPSFYRNARLFLFPSFYEGFGMPVLEAMACQCPVVTSGCSSLPEAGGRAAVYVNPFDTYDITNKTLNILENEKLRKKLIIEGLEHIRNFSWEATARNTVKVYEKTAGQ